MRRRAARDASRDAYERAFKTDPTSAYGGIIAFNRELDADTARAIVDQQFVEVILAPSIAEGAKTVLSSQGQRSRARSPAISASR